MWSRSLLLILFGSRYGPMIWSAIIPVCTLILNLCWWLWRTCAHGFSSAQTCILFRFKIPLRVNVHSSVIAPSSRIVAVVWIVVNTTPQTVLVVGSPPPVMRGLFADGMDGAAGHEQRYFQMCAASVPLAECWWMCSLSTSLNTSSSNWGVRIERGRPASRSGT